MKTDRKMGNAKKFIGIEREIEENRNEADRLLERGRP
jgi:hypothetical protein